MAKDIFEIEHNGEIFTVEADSDAEALALVQAQSTPAAATSPVEPPLDLLPMPDEGMSNEVAASGEKGLPPGTAGMTGALLATGASKYTEPFRRTAREGLRSVAETGTKIAPRFPRLVGSAVGAGFGGTTGAVVGNPFVGATIGAAAGGATGRTLSEPMERGFRVVEGGLDTKPLGTAHAPGVADKVADYAARPGLMNASKLAEQAKTEKGLGLEAPARESARRASEARTAASKTSASAYRNTRRARSIFDSIFGKAAAGGKLGPSKALPAIGALLGGYELFNIGKGIYDREAAGEDVPTSEKAMAAGMGILGLLPGMASASKAAKTLATGGRAAIAKEITEGAKASMRATGPARSAPAVAGRMSGAGPAGARVPQTLEDAVEAVRTGDVSVPSPRILDDVVPNNPVAQNLERERRAIEAVFKRRGGSGGGSGAANPPNLTKQSATDAVRAGQGPSGGARGVTGGSRSRPPADPPNLTRQSATEAVASGQGPSGGARGVTGGSRARSTPDPKNLVREPETLEELMTQAEREGLNPAAVAHRVGEWMRARGIKVEPGRDGGSLPRPKK